MTVRCPKCGRDAADDAVICSGCDFILDSSFLGDDIMDAEADRRVKAKDPSSSSERPPPRSSVSSTPRAPKNRKAPPAKGQGAPHLSRGARASGQESFSEKTFAAPAQDESWAADALILGDLDDAEVASFQASDTGLAQREVTMARMYVGGSIQALLMPDAIPEIAPDLVLDSVRVTPFERHVLELVNGKRPVARIKAKARLKDDDFQTALALLADKGFLQLKGHAKKVKKKPAPPRTPRVPSERTLIAELPSAHELDADDDVASDAGRFGFSEKTGPPPAEHVPREHTLIQPAPRFDDGAGDEEGADADAADADFSEVDRGPLSFADSLISEEDVFASAEEVLAKDAETAAPAAPPLPRAHRRPPLPGEVPAEALAAAEPVQPPEVAAAPDEAAAAAPSIHDEPTSDTHLATSEPPPARPPPLAADANQEVRAAAALEAEAVAFEDLETGLPSPLSVSAGDISLIEVTPPAAGGSRPPSLTTGTLPTPEAALAKRREPTPPAAIDVSDFSDPVARPSPVAAPPPLPGGNIRPPGVPGARVPPARAPRASAPIEPSPVDDKSEEQLAHDSDSGEAAPGAQVSFEMQRKAARIFEQAEKDIAAGNASSAIMNVKLALIYNPAEKRYRQFLQDWERMQAGEPAKASKEELLLEEAQALEQKGEHEEALAVLQKALERAPRNAGLHNRIGVLLATRLKRYKEAAEHVLTAIDLAPGNLAYKNNLGKILAKEESAIHKMPVKKSKKKDKDDDRVIVKKLRPKLF